MTGADLVARLTARGTALAAQRLRQAGARLAQRWRGRGLDVREAADSVTLAAADLARRRQGTRQRLPDADLIWLEE